MENTLYILVLVLVLIFGCQPKASQENNHKTFGHETKDNKEFTTCKTNNNFNSTNLVSKSKVIRTYVSDQECLDYDFQTNLKNGYRLDYKVYTESNKKDTFQTIFLMKDTIEIKELTEESSYQMLHKNLGYIGADFDSSFVFVQSFGSGNPHVFQLIDKHTGWDLLHGTWVDVDEKEQVLLYLENEHEDSEKLIVYDVKNNNKTVFANIYKYESKCLEFSPGGIRDCVSIDSVSSSEIIIIIENESNDHKIKCSR
jgi:hypothetical protein